MSDKPDIEAIKARLAELRRADEEYVSVTANRPAMEPEYNYHLRVARREVEAHAPDDIAALLAEVGRLKARGDILAKHLRTFLDCVLDDLEALAKRGREYTDGFPVDPFVEAAFDEMLAREDER